MYQRLYEEYGPQYWWPGETPFEIALGAILTQNTAWRNVEKAISAARANGVLSAAGLYSLPKKRLEELLRPSGYFRVKATRVRAFLKFLQESADGSVEGLRRLRTPILRKKLLSVKGLGPETVDSILLYSLNRTVFVVDAYTRRILSRHALLKGNEPYDEIRSLFQSHLPRSRKLYNEFHALFVRLGHTRCRPSPDCAGCPLSSAPFFPPKKGRGIA